MNEINRLAGPDMARSPTGYPEMLVVHPKNKTHKQSVIILHDRGSHPERNAWSLQMLHNEEKRNILQDAFPDAKFMFPTAPQRIHQGAQIQTKMWFDYINLVEPDARPDLQAEGLNPTVRYVHGLLQEEIAAVGAKNVVLWGDHEGAAAALISLLLWEGESFAACICDGPWLPLRKQVQEAIESHKSERDSGWKGWSGGDKLSTGKHFPLGIVVSTLRKILDLPQASKPPKRFDVPVLFAYGAEKDKEPSLMTQQAAELLEFVGVKLTREPFDWDEYPENLFNGVVKFLQRRKGWHGSLWSRVVGEKVKKLFRRRTTDSAVGGSS